MLVKIFSIYDSKVKHWQHPQFLEKTGTIMRAFEEIANDPKHQVGQHPEDFVLYEIGTWNDDTGEIKMNKHVASLGRAIDFVKPSQPSMNDMMNKAQVKNESK
jgi:hypothetical protein